MHTKILRRPMLAAGIAIAADIITLIAAAVLSALRGGIESTYIFTEERTVITQHPFDLFGIFAAAALVIVSAMAGLIIAGAFSKGVSEKKITPRIAGAAVLLVISAAVILLSLYVSRGEQPVSTEFYYYSDKEMYLTIAEEKYREDYGRVKIYSTDEEQGTAELLASTEITQFAENNERYMIEWIANDVLRIVFADGMQHKSLQIPIEKPEKLL